MAGRNTHANVCAEPRLDPTDRSADLSSPGHSSGPVPDGRLNMWGSPWFLDAKAGLTVTARFAP